MARTLIYERGVQSIVADNTLYEKLNSLENGVKIKEEPPDPDSEYLNNETTSPQEDDNSYARDQTTSSSLNNKENLCVPKKRSTRKNRRNDGYTKRRRRNQSKSSNKFSNDPVYSEDKQSKNVARNINRHAKPRREDNNLEQTSPNYERYNVPKRSARFINKLKQQSKQKCLIQCDVCFLPMKNMLQLKRHQESRSPGLMYNCKKCKTLFADKRSFAYHNATCNGVRNVQDVCCHYCKKFFRRKHILQAHIFHIHSDRMFQLQPTKISPVSPELKQPRSPKSRASLPKTHSNTPSYQTKSSSGQVDKGRASPQTPNVSNSDTAEASANELLTTPAKKMRQTTLTEFLKVSSKKVENVTPQKNEATGVKCTKSPQNSGTRSDKCPKPFVQIHTNTALMMELLNSSKHVKEEPLDDEVQSITSRQNTSYSLRPTRPAVYTPDTFFYLDSSMKRKRIYFETEQALDDNERGTPKRARRESKIIYSKLKARFGIKECYVPLVRYDSIKKTMESVSQEDPMLKASQEIGSPRKPLTGDPTVPPKNPQEPVLEVNEPSLEMNEEVKSEHDPEGSSLKSHSKPYQCKICTKMFSTKKNLLEHKELFHIAYISSICNARYTSKYKLLHHYLRQHTILKRTVCCVCRESFSSRSLLQRHLLIHCLRVLRAKHDRFPVDVITKCNAFQKNHLCCYCGKRFWLSSCLKQHENMCNSRTTSRPEKACTTQNMPSVAPSSTGESHVSDKLPTDNLSPEKHSPTKSASNEATINEEIPSAPKATESEAPEKQANAVPTTPASPTLKQQQPSESVKTSHKIKDTSPNSEATDLIPAPANIESSVAVVATNAIVECPVCNIKFNSIAKLTNHTKTYGGELNHHCSVCSLALPNKRLLDQHTHMAHAQNLVGKHKNNCKFCNQAFNSADHRQIHEKHFHASQITVVPEQTWLNEEQVWNINTVCNTCNVVFESYDRFVEHNMYYYKGQSFTCTFCRQTFDGLFMLHHHSKLVHYPEATRKSYSYICDSCNEGFNQESHFHAHKLHVHLSESLELVKPSSQEQATGSSIQITSVPTIEARQIAFAIYGCNICQMFFTNEADLVAHETEYSLNGDYLCNGCEKRCRTLPLLKQHYCLNHIGSPVPSTYKCKQCMEVFIAASALACHEKHVHPEESSQRYDLIAALEQNVDKIINAKKPANTGKPDSATLKCLICGTVFEKEIDLREHLFENSNIGEYSCAVCHRKFAETACLDQHKMKHSRINTILAEHHCPICQEGLASATNVKIHMLHFHGYESFQSVLAKRGCLTTKLLPDKTLSKVHKTSVTNPVPMPESIPGDEVNVKSNPLPENLSNTSTESTSNTAPEINSDVSKAAAVNKHNTEKNTSAVESSTNANPEEDRVIVEESNTDASATVQSSSDKPISSPMKTDKASVTNVTPQKRKKIVMLDPQGPTAIKFLKELKTLNNDATRNEEYRCVVCNFRSTNRRNIVFHIAKYVNRGNFVCNICPRRFPTAAFYQDHCRKHKRIDDGATEYCCPCQYCNERFRTGMAVRVHMRHLHKNQGPIDTNKDTPQSTVTSTDQPKQQPKDTEPVVDDQMSSITRPQRLKAPLQPESTRDIPELDSTEGVDSVQSGETSNLNKETKTDATTATAANAIPTVSEQITSSRLSFSCQSCSMSFDNFLTYHAHCRSVHPHLLFFVNYISKNSNPVSTTGTSTNGFKCAVCNISFENAASLNKHAKDVHAESPNASNSRIITTDNGSEDLKIVWEKKPEPKLYNNFRSLLQKNLAASLENADKIADVESPSIPRLKVKPFAKIIETLTIENQAEPPANIDVQILPSAQAIPTEASPSQPVQNTDIPVSNPVLPQLH